MERIVAHDYLGVTRKVMRTRLTLRPDQPGTLRLHAEHGDRLVSGRYRYVERTCKRLKTAELIVGETLGSREARRRRARPRAGRLARAQELRDLVKSAGGWWDRRKRVWELRYDQVTKLGLVDRIVQGVM